MAFTAATVWDVRTTGNDGNGGGFDPTLGGTDYTQQDSPQISYTDLAIDASNNLLITSTLFPFTSAHVGNVINITAGAGFTVQRVQVVSVASGVATCDKAVGSVGSVSGTGVLGGGLATIANANSLAVNGNSVCIKTGTYTLTSGIVTAAAPITFAGYNASHGDRGTAPLITTATNSIHLFTTGVSGAISLINLSLSNTSGSPGDGLRDNSGSAQAWVDSCTFDGFYNTINGNGNPFTTLVVRYCLIKNSQNVAVLQNMYDGNYTEITDTVFDSNYVNRASIETIAGFVVVERCLITNTTQPSGQGTGIYIYNQQYVRISNCTIALNQFDGISISGIPVGPTSIFNNIIYGNGRYGLCVNGDAISEYFYLCSNNAWGDNTGGNAQAPATTGLNPVSLSGTPFTNSSGGDFSLNSGVGAACKGAGAPSTLPGGTTATHLDIGCSQSTGSGGGGGGGSTVCLTTYAT